MCELPQTHPGHGKFGGSQFRYDAAVGGQIPIITLLQALGGLEVAGTDPILTFTLVVFARGKHPDPLSHVCSIIRGSLKEMREMRETPERERESRSKHVIALAFLMMIFFPPVTAYRLYTIYLNFIGIPRHTILTLSYTKTYF